MVTILLKPARYRRRIHDYDEAASTCGSGGHGVCDRGRFGDGHGEHRGPAAVHLQGVRRAHFESAGIGIPVKGKAPMKKKKQNGLAA